MKPICINLGECHALGDLICATPAIRVVSKSYNQKVSVISTMPEVFKNNPYVEKSYKFSSVDMDYINENYIVHNSFYNVGKRNESGVEYKHNRIDIRQFHAINLGFMLKKDEMECDYLPLEEKKIDLGFEDYVVIHPVKSWPVRTWSPEKWKELTEKLNAVGINVVSIGKDGGETGFFNVNKPVFNFEIERGANLMNKTTLSECWHIINNARALITMDSGILHLASATDTYIIQLGSSISPEFRIPYRFGSQQYKHLYVQGGCGLECASNMKYGIRQWGTIQGIPPLIDCLEGKEEFECHPSVDAVLEKLKSIL